MTGADWELEIANRHDSQLIEPEALRRAVVCAQVGGTLDTPKPRGT